MDTKHVWFLLFVFAESKANLVQYKYINGLNSNLESFIQPIALTQKSEYSPRRSLNYGQSASGNNPTIVAIPLYLRNSASNKPSALIEALSSSVGDSLLSKKVEGSLGSQSALKPQYSALRPEMKHHHLNQRIQYSSRDAQPHYETKFASSQYKQVVKPSEGVSYVDPGTLSLLANGGYSAASPTTHLSYAGNYGAQKPMSITGATSVRNPGLKVADYEGVQKSAFSDFTSALEGFDVKSISSQDLYNLPGLNAQTISGQAYSHKSVPAVKSHTYQDSGALKAPTQSYGSASSNYEVSFHNYPSPNYASPDSSYYGQRNIGVNNPVTIEKGDSPSSITNDGYNNAAGQEAYSNSGYSNGANSGEQKEYANTYANGAYANSQASSENSYSSVANSNKVVSGDSNGNYSPSNSVYAYNPSSSYTSVVPYESNFGSPYNTATSQPYSTTSANGQNYPHTQYVGKGSSHQSTQGEYFDHECPEKPTPVSDYTASSTSVVTNSKSNSQPTNTYGIINKATLSGAATSSSVSKASQSSTSSATQGFDIDDIDPSKLDLKIVHLPVSVLRKLVGNGEVALPSYQ